jgi:aryl-alcohol dehydrogenase-like predicted oxidoreductase
MKYRTLGRTGLQISELVFGGGKVGGILIFQDDETRRAAIRMALDGGINWIDTAPLYGDGKSEEALGWLLKEIDETPYLSTKVGLDPSRLDDIPGQIEESVHASLKRLGRDSVDLLQLHNPISNTGGRRAIQVDHVLGQGAAADGLERMRDQGLTRFIGITALGRAGDCRRVIDSGRFDTAQIYYNLLNPSAGRVLPEAWTGHDFTGVIAAARARDMGLLAIRILASGVLATDIRHGRESVIGEASDIPTEERRAAAVFAALGVDHGTRAQTAIRFVLANPDLSGAIVGLAELAHLEEALAAAEAGPLPPDALDKLDAVYAGGFGEA